MHKYLLTSSEGRRRYRWTKIIRTENVIWSKCHTSATALQLKYVRLHASGEGSIVLPLHRRGGGGGGGW